jgi:cytochrome P450
VDLLGEFTSPIAATVMARVLGIPPKGDDEIRFRMLARHATRSIRPFLSDRKQQKTENAAVEMCDYILGLAEARRLAPRDDLISDLLQNNEIGSSERLDDLVRVVAGLVSAGTGTTATAGARALKTLLQHPAELEMLRSDRSLLANGIDELLRYDSGLLVMPRYVTEAFEFRGNTFAKGKLVVLCLLGANRDPRVFVEPDKLDFRRDVRDALSFGHGSHYCIGSNIARTTMRSMIDVALDFLPSNARLREEAISWSSRGLMSQIKSLPVDFAT